MSARPGELTFQGELLVWINEIIKSENLPFDGASQEYIMEGQERPDILLWKNKRAREAALLLSLKVPHFDAWDAADDALLKASKWTGGIRYFSTWNINRFFLWDKTKLGDLYDALCYQKEVAKINRVEEYEKIEGSLKSFVKEFLKEFAEVYYERKLLPPLAIDERFIFRLRSAVDAFSIPTFFMIRDKYKDKEFRDKLRRWFAEQGWTFFGKDEDYEKVSRQYVYLLINKIMFYNILKLRNKELPKITVPLNIDGEQFREKIQSYFNRAIKIDYETIFATNFLDTIPIPDELTGQLRSFIDKISDYDYSKVGYEVLGRVFERLIPDRERHNLGQYYTRSDVVDLIVAFCVRSADDKVLDGACGAGTFLVRSYVRKGLLNLSKKHEELIDDLYGIDIAKFPTHLTTINLAIRDLSSEKNYPKVITKDFFDVKGKEKIRILGEDYVKQYATLGLDLEKFIIEIPECDAVVMNPPYTRQEEMEEGVFSEGYRTRLQELIKQEWDGFYVGKRSSIYSYFFIHGAKFLSEHGRLGLITSNSWLDVDYGKYLQEFFLKNFKIIAIIESKVERWFEDADINTAITILEKCSNEKERMNNLAKFVQLKKPLAHYIPPIEDERKRWDYVQFLIDRINKINKYYEDDELRVFVKEQKELWDEGYNEEDKVYEGSKWGKYLRAPEIFFKVLEKGKDVFFPLKEVAEVIGGLITGKNEFFYLNEEDNKKWKIESEYLLPVIKTPRELNKIRFTLRDTKYRLFHTTKNKSKLKGTNALKYIEQGEKQGLNITPTFEQRKQWYQLPELKTAPLLWVDLRWEKHICHLNVDNIPFEHNYYGINAKSVVDNKLLCAFLNSTLSWLFIEILGRTGLGQGAIRLVGKDLRRFPVIDFDRVKVRKNDQANI